jgi:hypothetical protein
MKREFVGLGHSITHRGIGISPEICDEIMEFPLPQTYADLSTFLGKTGYVSEHIAGYQTLVHNLRQVSQEGANSGKSLKMTACHIRDFHKLKHAAKALTGVMVDPGRQQSVAAIVQPRTYEDLERFLKLTGVLAKKIEGYDEMAESLKQLLATGVRKHTQKPSKVRCPQWTKEAMEDFQALKDAIAHAPLLGYYREDRRVEIAIDASFTGTGSCFYQPVGNEGPTADNIVTFRAHALQSYERSYAGSPYKLELLGLIRALQDYDIYIRHRKFDVVTDHRALTYLHSQEYQNPHLANWLWIIRQYQFDIRHVEGRLNIFPDALSRSFKNPWEPESDKSNEAMCFAAKAEVPAPTEEQIEVIKKYHAMGHFGYHHVLSQMKADNHQWPYMDRHIQVTLQNCHVCQHWNAGRRYFRELRSVTAAMPWDHIQFDLITSLTDEEDERLVDPNQGHLEGMIFINMFWSWWT